MEAWPGVRLPPPGRCDTNGCAMTAGIAARKRIGSRNEPIILVGIMGQIPPILFLLLSTVMSGCATHPTPDQLASADYGQLRAGYQEAIREFMYPYFVYPESARYRYTSEPARGYAYIYGLGRPPEYGYLVTLKVNAKNRIGDYAGEEDYTFLVKNDKVWRVTSWTTSGVVK
jgi:hypothetical protein